MIIARLSPWLRTQHCKVLHSHNIVHTLPPSTRIFNEASELNDLMYSNLDHADKKTLNNEDYIKKIMESEAQGSQVSSSLISKGPPPLLMEDKIKILTGC